MSRRIGLVALAGLMCGLCTAVVWADDLATVEKQISQAWDKHKSMTAKINMSSSMDMGGTVMESKGEGIMELMRKGDKTFYRMELKSTMPQPVGAEAKMEQNMLSILDGEFAWMLSEMSGQKMAMKTKPDPRMTGEPKAMFAEYRKDHELKLLPDDTVDGKKAYVVEATPKDKAAGSGKALLYFDKESGAMLKMVAQTPDGKPTMTMTYSDVKYDVDINPDRFVFKAPPGVEVQDMTKVEPAKPEPPVKPSKP
jgi:outer membrane lipoprotein-sorting protein